MGRKNKNGKRYRNRSIEEQFKFAVRKCFAEDMDKHSYKKQNGYKMDYNVFSHSDKFNLYDMSRMLSNYIKENHGEIKKIKDITPEIVKEYLDYSSKPHKSAPNGCTKNTISNYHERINKLAECSNRVYKVNLDYRDVERPICKLEYIEKKGAGNAIPKDNLDKIREYGQANRCQSSDVVEIISRFGCRRAEATYLNKSDVDIDKGIITFNNAKGGKSYTRELKEEDKELFKDIIDKGYSEDNRLFTVQGDTVRKYMDDVQERLHLEHYTVHDIRRRCCQDYYDELRLNDVSKEEATQLASMYLNHGPDREKLLEGSYISLW